MGLLFFYWEVTLTNHFIPMKTICNIFFLSIAALGLLATPTLALPPMCWGGTADCGWVVGSGGGGYHLVTYCDGEGHYYEISGSTANALCG